MGEKQSNLLVFFGPNFLKEHAGRIMGDPEFALVELVAARDHVVVVILLIVAGVIVVAGFMSPPEDRWISGFAALLESIAMGVGLMILGHRRTRPS